MSANARPHPVLDVHLMGGFASRMIEYMVARRIAAEVGNCLISNAVLPDWAINHPLLPGATIPEAAIPISRNDFDLPQIVNWLRSGEKTRVPLKSYATWLSNLPDLNFCRSIFKADRQDYPGFGPEYLVCSVRGGEILDGSYRDHVLLPIDFYADLARSTGLKLAFVGQIASNSYCDALRQRFPGAAFQSSRGPLADFQTLRNSKNLVLAVSTLSWLAGWLSTADMIVLPMSGVFHPVQCPGIDLLPYADERYRFYLFPKNYAAPLDRLEDTHRALHWRYFLADKIPELRASVYRCPARFLDQFLSMFDEEFYLKAHADVARVVRAGKLPSGRDHYVTHGFGEGRRCFPFDDLWYGKSYPMAELEVRRGDYETLLHHFVLVGVSRGYKPTPAISALRKPTV
jgi:hypothetical protein